MLRHIKEAMGGHINGTDHHSVLSVRNGLFVWEVVCIFVWNETEDVGKKRVIVSIPRTIKKWQSELLLKDFWTE